MAMISYAQNFEDVVLMRALKDVNNGFYIDVGAFSPDFHSVTKAFYERGWRGINIEPNPECEAPFKSSRPRDVHLAVAVGDVQDRDAALLVPAPQVVNDPQLDGVVERRQRLVEEQRIGARDQRYRPIVDFETGLTATIDWYRQEKARTRSTLSLSRPADRRRRAG